MLFDKQFTSLPSERQLLVLAQCAHNVTVASRDAPSDAALRGEWFRRCNEILHQLTSQQVALLEKDDRRYSWEALGAAIGEAAGNDSLGTDLMRGVTWAFNLALSRTAA